MNHSEMDSQLKRQLKRVNSDTPEIIYQRIDQTLQQLPVNRKLRRHVALTACAFILCFVGLTVSAFFSPAVAQSLQNLPFLSTIFQKSGDEGLRQASSQGFTDEIKQSVNDQGLEITVDEVLYDGSRIAIGYSITDNGEYGTSHPDKLKHFNQMYEGRSFYQASILDQYIEISEDDFIGIKEMKLSINGEETAAFTINNTIYRSPQKQHYIGFSSMRLPTDLPDEFTLSLSIQEIGQLQGDWSFHFPVSRVIADQSTTSHSLEMEETIGDATLSVTGVNVYPSSTAIHYSLSYPSDGMTHQYLEENELFFRVQDEHGIDMIRQVRGTRLIVTENMITEEFTTWINPLSANHSFVTLQPQVLNRQAIQFNSAPFPDTFPLIISQGDVGELQINDIKHFEDRTLVFGQALGQAPYEQSHELWFEDQRGFKTHFRDITYTHSLDEEHPGAFVLEFPYLRQEVLNQLHIVTRELSVSDLWKEFRMEIPLN
ncbi:DUF4179 domain-containing protein [Bacillus horti]|uniref:DUF4179 domain-containing protein n=1 Tax=Caldalkalibacillus horti TaxID=77523 RepID=A0ABT9VWL8_9BACI|nr:DUF4179 domain-containing protein [Bacillus horti]MDQ0165397.1 hypothetical protein [Bacillus horti]